MRKFGHTIRPGKIFPLNSGDVLYIEPILLHNIKIIISTTKKFETITIDRLFSVLRVTKKSKLLRTTTYLSMCMIIDHTNTSFCRGMKYKPSIVFCSFTWILCSSFLKSFTFEIKSNNVGGLCNWSTYFGFKYFVKSN